MAEQKALTPAMRQYLDIKSSYADSILFFRMGDFYEMFFEDAVTASKALGLALTSRDRERDIPMCGVPWHSANSYIARLVKEGHKVAVCEQVEDPSAAKGIVERAVTKVITPGVAIEDELLDPKSNNYIAAAFEGVKACGFAYMDVSTGEFRLTEVDGPDRVLDEIRKIRPLELVLMEGQCFADGAEGPVKKTTFLSPRLFDKGNASERLRTHFGTATLDGFGCAGLDEGVRAAGALLQYIKDTQKNALSHVRKCAVYSTGDYLVMDGATRRSLEITQNMRTGGREGTLLDLLDRTRTAMGSRRLKDWLLHPLTDLMEIKARQNAISDLIEKKELRVHIKELLAEVYDLERLSVKVSLKSANPRDLAALKASLLKIPLIKNLLRFMDSGLLSTMYSSIDEVDEAVEIISKSIVEAPPFSVRDGGVIRDGYNASLDELRSVAAGGKEWVARLEAEERQRTGINSLKVGYNRVFGYYIEVTRANLASVPPEYIRKQTLVNAERFVTPALKEWEEKILSAHERSLSLEAAVYSEVLDRLSALSERIQRTSSIISTLDAVSSLSEAAQSMNYVKPVIDTENVIEIEAGRHPVIESLSPEGFVANDLKLDGDGTRVMILTGPNMAGKSTYLRQNALVILMAQTGSFVPASRARIGLVDRIFSRVGASDDLSRGQSTFMVEMSETANILNSATPRSFVILDEIGRGTSTFDGLSIAWAVAEYLHDSPSSRPRTIFATHYHELTELSLTKESVKNYNMAVKEWNDKIIFLRKVVPGGASRSYGIHVARLAGLPASVIERAREILKNLETGELSEAGLPRIAERKDSAEPLQLSLLGERDPLREALRRIDIDDLRPVEALNALLKLQGMLKE